MSLQVSDKPIDTAGINVESKSDNNHVSTTQGFVTIDKSMNNIGSAIEQTTRTIAAGNQPIIHSEMDKALGLLNAIENACDSGTKAQLNLDQKTQHVGTVKNLFYKFLGLFSKSLENSKRTQALNAKWHSVATRLKDDKNLYNGVLLSTLNDPKLDASLKTICFRLYDGDPDTQDKLFASLKEPPKEIREIFWEKYREKILSGEFFGFKLKDMNAEAIKNEFMSVEKEPLQSLFKNISAEECKNLNEYRNIFEKSVLPNIFTKKEHVETFLMSYFSVTEEHAKTLLQDDIEAVKVENLKEEHRQNAEEIIGILLKEEDNPGKLRSIPVLPFRELFQGGDGKRFTFTVNGQTVCDIDGTKLKELAKSRASAEQEHLNKLVKLAENEVKQAKEECDRAPEGSEEEDVAWDAWQKAEKKLQQVKENVKNYKPTVKLNDFWDEIKTQIKAKNIEKASIEKLALFLASGVSLMPPTDQFGRGICNMDRCHCNCTVSEDGTLTINQKFDKTKSAQEHELASRFRKATADFQSVGKKCYTETTMEIERTYDLFTSGSRNPTTAELKSFEHTVNFTD